MFALGFSVGPMAGVLVWHLLGREVWWWCGLAGLVGLAAAWPGMQTAAHEDDAKLVTVPDAMSEAVLDDAALPDSAVQPDAATVSRRHSGAERRSGAGRRSGAAHPPRRPRYRLSATHKDYRGISSNAH